MNILSLLHQGITSYLLFVVPDLRLCILNLIREASQDANQATCSALNRLRTVKCTRATAPMQNSSCPRIYIPTQAVF